MADIATIKKLTLLVALAAWMPVSAAEQPTRAKGYLSLPGVSKDVQRIGDTRTSGLKRAAKAAPLPEKFDMRGSNWVTQVKTQGDVNACWAFAAIGSLESQLLRANQGEFNLSEKNMANLHGWNLDFNRGGIQEMSEGYFLRWGGAVAEDNDKYIYSPADWESSPSHHLPPIVHVQHVVWTEKLDGTNDETKRNNLKKALMDYGAVDIGIGWYEDDYEQGVTYNCTDGGTNVNHAVLLVGWDDKYPTTGFKVKPANPGAWIIKNSWGTDWGDEGYYYVSYEDKLFGTDDVGAIYIPASADENYDIVRGYDPLGPVYDVSQTYTDNPAAQLDLQAAAFTAGHSERLEAVGVWTLVYPNDFEISIYTNVTRNGTSPITNGVLAATLEGTFAHAGFTTVHLDSSIDLVDGDGFAVVYRPRYRTTMVNCALGDWCEPTHNYCESYFGRTNGMGVVTWKDGKNAYKEVDKTDKSWGACIKAYTRLTGKVREGDKPAETDIGDDYLADLAVSNSILYAETGRTFGASAGMLGANGRTLWASWLTGLNPGDHGATDLKLSIAVTNSVPYLSWTPKLDERHYTVYGTTALGPDGVWEAVGDLATTTNRFFKVAVEQTKP